jgi:drug/metabolite transporter (DMT)-like permease
MHRRLDTRTLLIMLAALAVGVGWAAYNLASTGGARNDSVVRALVWAVFAGPFALFLGWLVARRRELGLAAFCCFCLYFFTFFVAQRVESLAVSAETAAANGHILYFNLVIAIHAVVGAGLALWRALAPPPPEPVAEAVPEG